MLLNHVLFDDEVGSVEHGGLLVDLRHELSISGLEFVEGHHYLHHLLLRDFINHTHVFLILHYGMPPYLSQLLSLA